MNLSSFHFASPSGNQSQNEVSLLTPLCALHRAPDSYIGFVRRSAPDGMWQNLFSLRQSELQTQLPKVTHWLTRDAYFTINGMYRAAPFINQQTQLADVWRKERYLRYLNACYADLDIGRNAGSAEQRLTWRDAVAEIGNMMDAEQLPQSSIFARSGRGIYIFWMLHDEQKSELPPSAWPEAIRLYKAINRKIAARLQCVAADASATDGARVLRVPNTEHSRSDVRAMYQVQHDGKGHVFSYTLRELADFFEVPQKSNTNSRQNHVPCEQSQGADKAVECQTQPEHKSQLDNREVYGRRANQLGAFPLRANGPKRRGANRAQDLLKLEHHYGGWPKGRRLFHLRLYANFLRAAGNSPERVYQALVTMAENCHPPYPSDPNDTQLRKIVGNTFAAPIRIYRTDTLLQWLGLTETLCRELDLTTLVPAGMRQSNRRLCSKREQQSIERRTFLREYISQYGVLSCRKTQRVLMEHGFAVSHQTVNDDLKSLR